MTGLSALTLEFQELVRHEDPHWLAREPAPGEIIVETSYPLEPETCGQIVTLFRTRLIRKVLDVSFVSGKPQRVYRREKC